jgi:tetratricopeptide (TPR) repeat protein
MDFDRLDIEELLRLALEAIKSDRDAEAISMLKQILVREPEHLHATYLLAAQHAQIGMFDRAEIGLRKALSQAPDFGIARFQLGQLLTMKGEGAEARDVLLPLCDGVDALASYARAISAMAAEDIAVAVQEIGRGLDLQQEIPALADDMRRLRERLAKDEPRPTKPDTMSAPAYFVGHGYPSSGGVE